MVSPLRLVLVALGLAAVVYGTASVIGEWWGQESWRAISTGVVAAGVAVVEIGAWAPRRRVGLRRPGRGLGRTLGFGVGSILASGGVSLLALVVGALIEANSHNSARRFYAVLMILPVALCAALLGTLVQFVMRRRADDSKPSRASGHVLAAREDGLGAARGEVERL